MFNLDPKIHETSKQTISIWDGNCIIANTRAVNWFEYLIPEGFYDNLENLEHEWEFTFAADPYLAPPSFFWIYFLFTLSAQPLILTVGWLIIKRCKK